MSQLALAAIGGPWTDSAVRGRIADALGIPRTELARHKRHEVLRKAVAELVASRGEAPHVEVVEDALFDVFRRLRRSRRPARGAGPVPGAWYALVQPPTEPEPGVRGAFPMPVLPSVDAVAGRWGERAEDLAWLADVSGRTAARSEASQRHYHARWVPKRGGVGQRLLEIPKPRLLRLQRKLLDDVVSAIPTHSAAHGFVRGRSLLGHVRPHCGQEVVVTLDLQSWFWHVGFARIYGLFRRGGLSRPVARTLAGLAVTSTALDVLHDRPGRDPSDPALFLEEARLRGSHLAQGAPSSPALANAVAWRMDARLEGLGARFGARYTRYADDLAFSGDRSLGRGAERLVEAVATIARDEGFQLNRRKTRVQGRSQAQRICGVIVNDHPAVPRRQRERLEATLVPATASTASGRKGTTTRSNTCGAGSPGSSRCTRSTGGGCGGGWGRSGGSPTPARSAPRTRCSPG